ncbi:DNA repair and recombination protein pif1 [Coprinopsis cinerea okayama7|uniref:ATP-dependent DNA helicase PIF1 n=1 Tax=Coprinopsis cinerea (strain Okayama-7 / 130 / ATCC MYA-4618 / FGSC 9003) TaxID=240176 RepID=A8N8Y7_COPC7|nr:DNA repair and recombination protein pif1 [Coprinopsis cinerea okayama7\|eukprot:XP_001831315.2 DNA repair and recombination protein pif1 [Coprinopsis cinerea okayama7\
MSSRKAMSGLGSVKRDWSQSSLPASSQEVPIPWEPSPPRQQPQKRPMTDAEKRLANIQAALQSVQSNKPPAPLQTSEAANRRPKRPSLEDADAPPSKKRQLPASWAQSNSGFGKDSIAAPQTSGRSSKPPSSKGRVITPSSSGSSIFNNNSKKGVAAVFLSQEQLHILKLVQEGHSVFYTGSAGTGKSVLLREIIKVLNDKYKRGSGAVAITASTGIAACNIGGTTIHSFAGIGLGIEPAEQLATKIRRTNRKAFTRWTRTKVLIIDEISMVEGDLFDKLAKIGSILRGKPEPFGGIQVIVTGDFFQLPPVTKSSSVKFAFEAETWSTTLKHTFNLTKVFRQRDQTFVDMLNEMRFGTLSQKSIAKFYQLARPLHFEDGVESTELFPIRDQVDASNHTRMSRLQTEEEVYRAHDSGTMPMGSSRTKLLASFMVPGEMRLRIGAQVMLVKNYDEILVNGTLGKVVDFVDPDKLGDELASYTILGGTSTSPTGTLTVKKMLGAKRYPVVDFYTPKITRRRVLVLQDSWKSELPTGEVQLSRVQLPLILAWAMSIHKSQGQTLERVKVDLDKVFEKGQAYVALSRATSLEGLQVINFRPEKVQAHSKVLAWSKTLKTVTDTQNTP